MSNESPKLTPISKTFKKKNSEMQLIQQKLPTVSDTKFIQVPLESGGR